MNAVPMIIRCALRQQLPPDYAALPASSVEQATGFSDERLPQSDHGIEGYRPPEYAVDMGMY